MRKITREISTAFLDSRSLYRDNTTTDGSEIRLFGNLIAYWDTDFTVAITLAGWNTATTRERLNGLLELMNVEKRIVSKGGVPYMSYQNRVHFKRIHLHGHYTVEYDFLSPENYARITGTQSTRVRKFFETNPRCRSGIFGNPRRINAILSKLGADA